MPISRKEVELLKQRLQEIDGELHAEFGVGIKCADYEPRPSDLFEHYVLYNAALAVGPDSLKVGRLTRGDFRSSGILPFPGLKSYKTTWRMGETLAPDISILKEGKSVSFWFDKSLESGTRPDIVLRLGVFEVKQVDSPYTAVQLFKDGELFAEYADIQLEQEADFFVERQTMDWGPEGRREISFRAREEFKHPPLIFECKSLGARLGSLDKYSNCARDVVVVSPEKLYQPKAANLHIVRVERDFDNKDLRTKMRPFIKKLID